MLKRNLKFLFLITVITVCFASNLPAMQADKKIESKSQSQEKQQLLEQVDYLQEFAKKIINSKVTYDGGNIKFYTDNSSDRKAPLIIIGLFTLCFFGMPKCQNDDDVKLACAVYFLLTGLPILSIIKSLYRETSTTPIMTIGKDSIESPSGKKIKWTDLDKMTFFDNTILLCNKYGKPLFIVDTNHLSINVSELISLLEFCLKEYGTQEKAPADLSAKV